MSAENPTGKTGEGSSAESREERLSVAVSWEGNLATVFNGHGTWRIEMGDQKEAWIDKRILVRVFPWWNVW